MAIAHQRTIDPTEPPFNIVIFAWCRFTQSSRERMHPGQHCAFTSLPLLHLLLSPRCVVRRGRTPRRRSSQWRPVDFTCFTIFRQTSNPLSFVLAFLVTTPWLSSERVWCLLNPPPPELLSHVLGGKAACISLIPEFIFFSVENFQSLLVSGATTISILFISGCVPVNLIGSNNT